MSKKALTILILFALAIVAGLAFLYYFLFGIPGQQAPDLSQVAPTGSTNLFPFGSPAPVRRPVATSTSNSELVSVGDWIAHSVSSTIPKLEHITLVPVAGAVASTTASTTAVRYVDRGTGHIYDKYTNNGPRISISNTTIPKIYEALWDTKSSLVFLRYLSEVTESIQTLATKVTPVKISTSYFSRNIQPIVFSPKSDQVFYIIPSDSGAVGYISNLDESKRRQIFDSPFKHWQIQWPEANTVTVTTAPSGVASGHLYTINAQSGSITKVLGPIFGLTTLTSPDAKKILYSESIPNSINTYIYDTLKGESALQVYKTLPEKCVWSTSHKDDLYCAIPVEFSAPNIYPDAWYQGSVQFVDQIWYIQTNTGRIKLLSNLLNDAHQPIDAYNLSLDQKDRYLIFTNKFDLSEWALNLDIAKK